MANNDYMDDWPIISAGGRRKCPHKVMSKVEKSAYRQPSNVGAEYIQPNFVGGRRPHLPLAKPSLVGLNSFSPIKTSVRLEIYDR